MKTKNIVMPKFDIKPVNENSLRTLLVLLHQAREICAQASNVEHHILTYMLGNCNMNIIIGLGEAITKDPALKANIEEVNAKLKSTIDQLTPKLDDKDNIFG